MANTFSVQINFKGNATKAVAAANNVAKALNRVAAAAKRSGGGMRTGVKSGGALAGTLKSLQKGAMSATNTFMNMGNSIRLAAQGMMSVGRAMTFFLTPVIFGILIKATQAAIDFDDALVRVKKTTSSTKKELAEIARGLRDLATITATGVVDLAKMAEQIGQVGVRAPEAIVGLTKIFNMLVIATDLTADKVGLSMGKIASAFSIDLDTDEGVEQIGKLSSVINRLENDMATTAPEIVRGLLMLAEVGALIDFPPQTGAAFVAALTAAGFSASRAGTALKNMTTYVITNADEISSLMRNTKAYATEQDVLTAINEDAARVLIDLVTAASMADDKARTLGATVEALGRRGGVGWSALAGAVDNFKKALGLADDEWQESLSLIREYEEALLSTKSQLAVLKNNVTEIALTLAKTLLPVLNHLIQVAVPGIRKLTEVFRSMSPEMQKMIIVGMALVGLAGPFIFFFSQMVFGFSMIWISITRAMQVFIKFGAFLGKIVVWMSPAIASLGSFILSWQALVVAVVAGAAILLLKFTKLGTKVAEFFLSLAESARSWGEALITEYGTGILAGAAMVLAKVLTAIGNFIGKFLSGASPPEMGPLKHIGKWGQTVFDEYLKGFLKADFGILSSVGNIIQGVLKNFEVVGNIGEGMQFKFAADAREALAKLIDRFNETGEISQDVLNEITKNLGEAADEVQTLIRLWLDYTRIQKELADLDKKREGVLDTYRQEIQLIAQSNMTAEEKADAIRQAMRARDDELRLVEQAEDVLEDELDIAKEQLDMQKAMVAAMQKQDDLQASLIKTLDKLASKLKDIGAGFALPSLDALIPDDLSKKLEEAFEPILTLEERFAQGEKAFDGFFSALKGAPFDDTLFAELKAFDEENGTDFANTYKNLWELGNNLFTIWEKISGVWEKAKLIWDSLFGDEGLGKNISFEGVGEGIGEFFQNIWESLPLDQWIKEFIEKGIASLGESLGVVGESFGGLIDTIKEITESPLFQTLINEILPTVLKLLFQIGGIAFGVLIWAISLIVKAFGFVIDALTWVMKLFYNIPVTVVKVVSSIIEWFKRAGDNIGEAFKRAKTIVKNVWAKIKTVVGEKIEEIIVTVKAIPGKISSALAKLKSKVVGKFTEAWEKAKEKIDEIWGKIKDAVGEAIENLLEGITENPIVQLFLEWKDAVSEAWNEIWEALKEAFAPIIEDIVLIVSTIWERIREKAEEAWTSLVDWLTTTWEGILTRAEEILGPIVDWISEKWDMVKTAVETKWEEIKTAITTKWEEIKTAIRTKIDEIKTAISEKWESIKNRAKIAWAIVRTLIKLAWEKIKTTIGQKITAVVENLKAKWESIKNRIKIAWAIIRTVISLAWDKIKKTVLQKLEAVKSTILGFKDKFVQAGKNIINGIKDGVIAAAKGLISAVAGAVQGALDWVKKKLNMTSPSRVMMEMGVNAIMGMAIGVEQAGSSLGAAMQHTIDSDFLGTAFAGLSGSTLAPASGAGMGNIELNFGRDSVRSDRDIDEIVERVKSVLASDAEDAMSMGTPFGGDL